MLPALADPPGFNELPVNVDGVVQVQQEAFASVKEAEAEDVVVDEGCPGVEESVPDEDREKAAGAPLAGQQRGNLGAVAVHVLQVDGQVGVREVEHVVFELARWA